MSLVDKQSKFTFMVARLLIYAEALGYQITFGDAFRDVSVTYGHPRSCHRFRLAIDLNLFISGEYIITAEGHQLLGVFWEAMGGSWGGRFDDANHYSLEHEGVK